MIEFQDFGIEDNARYSEYLKRCIQIPSNASPMNLLGSQAKYKVQRGYAADLCWHKYVEDGEERWTAPVGDWDEVNWQKVFAEHVPADTTFYFVPEYLLKLWREQLGSAINVEDDRDDWDYILRLDRMEKLEGKNFEAFRNDINAFEENYNYTVEEITPKIFDELKAFQADKLEDAKDDNAMFLFALEHWDEFKDLFGFVVRVDGQIVAYCLDEQIDEMHSIGLFAKADYEFKGANQFAYRYDAKLNLERGNLTQNLMADVGEENLRFFKEHLYPPVMLKKFIVTYAPIEKICDVKISSVRNENNLTLKISGKLNTDSANSVKNEIISALDGVKKLTLDLNGLEYISSSGLRILIAALKKIRAQGGTMNVKNAGVQVREVLEMTGFAEIFNLGWRPKI